MEEASRALGQINASEKIVSEIMEKINEKRFIG